MATYAVGDIQGCFISLERLLASASFNPQHDYLWVAGDLINRGPNSLEALRYIKALGEHAVVVLGNHDLHLLAVAAGVKPMHRKDTLSTILAAPDKDELLNWLRHRPILHSSNGYTMSHAGIPPIWSLAQAKSYAREVEAALQSKDYSNFLANIYGDQPSQWSPELQGYNRLRLITNYFTRMRFCDAAGRLDLAAKEGLDKAPSGLAPWFALPHLSLDKPILFGHWAALNGKTSHPNAIALDTGCVWGGQLSMMRLEDQTFFRVPSELNS